MYAYIVEVNAAHSINNSYTFLLSVSHALHNTVFL